MLKRRLTQHIHYGLTPLSFGTLLPSVATSFVPETLSKIGLRSGSKIFKKRGDILGIWTKNK